MTCSSPDFGAALASSSEAIEESLFSLLGDMGIESRGTGELGFNSVGAASRFAMMG